MKRARKLLLAVFLLTPVTAVAQNTPQDRHPEWFACKKDEDCAITCQPCGDAAINAKFMSHASEILLACLQAAPCFPYAEAHCVERKCTVQIPEEPTK